jgi:hypothetical protein
VITAAILGVPIPVASSYPTVAGYRPSVFTVLPDAGDVVEEITACKYPLSILVLPQATLRARSAPHIRCTAGAPQAHHPRFSCLIPSGIALASGFRIELPAGGCSHEKSAFELGGLGLSRVLSVPELKALSR